VILLLSHDADAHAIEVLRRLRAQGADVVMFDTAQFPTRAALTVTQSSDWAARLETADGAIDLTAARVAWWRRPMPFELHTELNDPEDRAFAYGECQAAVAGLWASLDATWINDPDRDQLASRKLNQLKVATGLGLRTPRTCITNDPAEATRFAASEGAGGVIYKSFAATATRWRETRVLRPDEHRLLDHVRASPVIFQEHIPAAVDLRITVIGRELFPAAIHSQDTDYPHDFRMSMDQAEMRPYELPPAVEKGLLALMDHFDLLYGAIDMRLTPDGEHVFLEINPAGQWLFVEVRTGQPITQALCDLMLRLDQAT